MIKRQSYSAHAKATLGLGLPLIGSHLAQMSLHVTDTVLLGWYGVNELAAVVLATSSFFVIFILGSGFAQAVMPMVASALGRGDEAQVRRDTRMGLWLSIGFGMVTYPLFWFAEPILLALGQRPEVAILGQDFLRIGGLGMIPALLVMALKSYLAALERTQVVLITTVLAVGVNLVLDYALIFGHWGAPELGVRGAAMASLLVQCLTFAVLALYAAWLPELKRFHLFQRFWRPDWQAMGQVFRLGWPIGVTALAESALFQATALMMGWIGTVELAAHGITMEIAALSFMVHLGLSNAATVRISRAEGAGDLQGLARRRQGRHRALGRLWRGDGADVHPLARAADRRCSSTRPIRPLPRSLPLACSFWRWRRCFRWPMPCRSWRWACCAACRTHGCRCWRRRSAIGGSACLRAICWPSGREWAASASGLALSSG